MASLRRRVNRILSPHFPEKRLFIQSGSATSYVRLTPFAQLALGTGALVAAAWMAVATATVVTDLVGAGAGKAVVLHDALRVRLDEMAAERDRLKAEVQEMQNLTRRMSDEYLDLDLLDERAREMLGLIRADEVILR